MCRWFAYISATEECLLEDVLVLPQHSLSKMVNEHYVPGLVHIDPEHPDRTKKEQEENKKQNLALNIDGLGLVWYTDAQTNFIKGCEGRRPAMYKSVSPPLNDYNYQNLCANTATKTLFAHVRATSGSPVMQSNSHPFIFGRQAFMHNGTIKGFSEIRRKVCNILEKDAYYNVGGSTDSEHLAALYMTILTRGKDKSAWEQEYSAKEMARALREAVGQIITLQRETLGSEAVPSSLNLAVTDGNRLVTFRFRNHRKEQPPSLYWSTTAGVTLNRKYPKHADGSVNIAATKKPSQHGNHLIVASEPTTMDVEEWHLIDKNHCIMFENGKTTIEKIPVDDSWYFTDVDEKTEKTSTVRLSLEKLPERFREKPGSFHEKVPAYRSWSFDGSEDDVPEQKMCKCIVS